MEKRERDREKPQHRGCIVYDALGRPWQPYWIPLAAVDQNYKAEHASGPRMLQHPSSGPVFLHYTRFSPFGNQQTIAGVCK